MNSSNALGFLVVGSLMNALPALAPSLVAHGMMVGDGLSESALWLHFMGLLLSVLGSTRLLADGVASYRAASRAAVRLARGAVQPAPAQVGDSLQTA